MTDQYQPKTAGQALDQIRECALAGVRHADLTYRAEMASRILSGVEFLVRDFDARIAALEAKKS